MTAAQIRKRLERLERANQKREETIVRDAMIILSDEVVGDDWHLKITTSPDAPACWFVQKPGPGPKLADFGKFRVLVELTAAEAEF